MDLGIEGRVALVTGASAGLGLASARALALEGAAVAVAARRRAELTRAAAALAAESRRRVLPVVADVTDAGAVTAAVREVEETLGPIDILVANGGGPPPTTFAETTEEQYRAALELNLLSMIRLTRLCVPGMRTRKWGRVIYLTSIAAKQPIPGLLLSNTARAGLAGFAKTVATECARDGVLVNTILTGHFDTARATELAGARAARERRPVAELLAERNGRIPIGRAGDPAELAAVVAFLASERAGFLTGAAIPIDGGQSATVF